MSDDSVEAEVLAGRLASLAAARAVLDTSVQLVEAMPTVLLVDADVYAGLQRLACHVETAIAAADHARRAQGDS